MAPGDSVSNLSPPVSAPAGRARVRFPLRYRLGLLVTALAAVPLMALGIALIDVNTRAVTDLSERLHRAAATDVAETLEHTLKGAEDALDAVGRSLTDDRATEDARLASAVSLVGGSAAIDHAAVYDTSGERIDVIREESGPAGGSARREPPTTLLPSLRAAAERTGAATGEVLADSTEARVFIAVPLRVEGRVTGYAGALVSLTPVSARVHELVDDAFGGALDAIAIVDDKLRFAVHLGHRLGEDARNEPALYGIQPGTLSKPFVRSGEVAPPDGEVTFSTLISVPHRGMAIYAQVPRSVALASLVSMRQLTIGAVIAAAMLAALLAALLAARVTRPIEALVAFTRELAARRFGGQVDASGTDEVALLAGALNTASSDLQASEERMREEAAIRADLGRYLPAEVVERVVSREQPLTLGGERRDVTVVFADVAGFTPLSERLPPEEVVSMLNDLFTVLTEVIFQHGGMVDKFIGDSVMAVFGVVDDEHSDHADRAVAAAEDMLTWLETANESIEARVGVRLRLSIGVNTGPAVVGNVGSERRMEFTAIGETVNVAARLEAAARPQQILIGSATRAALRGDFPLESVGEHTLPGMSVAQEVFALEGDR